MPFYRKIQFAAIGLQMTLIVCASVVSTAAQAWNCVFYGDSLPPVQKVQDLLIYQDSSFYSSFPSVVKLPSGEYYLAFRRAPERTVFGEEGTNHVDPNSYLVAMRSSNGIEWGTEPKLMYAHPFGGSQDPCLLLTKDGSLLCTSYGWAFVRSDSNLDFTKPYLKVSDHAVFLGGFVLRSEDQGESWQGPTYPAAPPPEIRISALSSPLPAYNRGALAEGEDGRLYWAVAVSQDATHPQNTSVHLLTSDDRGDTWDYSCPVAVDSSVAFNETSLYRTPQGDLLAFLRTAGFEGQAAIARSVDGGKSFQAWQGMGFVGYPLHALRLSDDRILLTYGYRQEPYGIRARLLNPEGTDFATAPEIILRDDGGTPDLGYPWATQLDDRRVLVVYYFNVANGPRHIAGTILGIE